MSGDRLGEQITAEAWEKFDQWCRQHDPEGNMDLMDLVDAYDLAHRVSLTDVVPDDKETL